MAVKRIRIPAEPLQSEGMTSAKADMLENMGKRLPQA